MLFKSFSRAAASLLAATALSIGCPEPASAQQSVQQQFEAASAALLQGKWDEALSLFIPLEARLARGTDAKSLAVVRVRMGEALLRLGRNKEAGAKLREGVDGISPSDAVLNEDRTLGLIGLGEAALLATDARKAVEHFRAAERSAAQGALKLRAAEGLIATIVRSSPVGALAEANRVIATPAFAAADRKVQARLRNLRTLALLSAGRLDQAREEAARVAALAPELVLAQAQPARGVVTANVPANAYDPQALSAGEQGNVRIAFTLAPGGAISGCRVKQPSASARLNAIACDFVEKRAPLNARLIKAMALEGAPNEMIVSWRLFDTEEATAVNTATSVWVNHALSDMDYPAGSVSRREQGTVRYQLDVDSNGMPTRCTVIQSSGYAALDTTTCRLMSERYSFLPAIDDQGRRQASSQSGRITWRLP